LLFLKGREKETMQKRRLGNEGLEVSAIGFGCMGLKEPLNKGGLDCI
jgi:aryl-alcohol dehydrogenase-like predicted oxidoreductase